MSSFNSSLNSHTSSVNKNSHLKVAYYKDDHNRKQYCCWMEVYRTGILVVSDLSHCIMWVHVMPSHSVGNLLSQNQLLVSKMCILIHKKLSVNFVIDHNSI